MGLTAQGWGRAGALAAAGDRAPPPRSQWRLHGLKITSDEPAGAGCIRELMLRMPGALPWEETGPEKALMVILTGCHLLPDL